MSKKILLILILTLALFLRLWKITQIPPGLTPDEASLGYNAYSILTTGKDEWGQTMPLILKSFGDYTPALYLYLTLPFIAILGLNELSVRLPNVLAGVIAVALTYFIVNEIKNLKIDEKLKIGKLKLGTAYVAALLLAISPWHIHFSRGAWVLNTCLTITLFGVLFFIKALKKPKFALLSALFFSLTLLAYQGAKFSTPVVMFSLLAVYKNACMRILKNNKKIIITSLFIGVVVSLPVIFSFIFGQTGRLKVLSVFNFARGESDLNNFLAEGNEKQGGLSYLLYHTEDFNFLRGIVGRYFNYFSGKFLFFEGDWQNPRQGIPNMGVLYWYDSILLLAGIISVIKKTTKFKLFTLVWLFLAPLPAVFTLDQIHSARTINMVIPIIFIEAMGATYIVKLYRSVENKFKYFALPVFVGLVLTSWVYFTDAYFVHLPKHNAFYWFYGYKQFVSEILTQKDNYSEVVINQSYDQPYIFFLFYGTQFGYKDFYPKNIQGKIKLIEDPLDVGLVPSIDILRFERFSWPYEKGSQESLIAGNYITVPDTYSKEKFTLVKEINFPNGDVAFRIVTPK